MTYFDDNFGHWEMESDDDLRFYRQVQRQSVTKTCEGCKRKVRILPQYAYCDRCATAIERGGEF